MNLSLPFQSLSAGLKRSPHAGLRVARNAAVAAAMACLAAGMAHADIDLQGWIPKELTIPSDAEVLMDRRVGSTVRLFSFQSAVDPSDLLSDWEDTLETNGYVIQSERDEQIGNAIGFTGPGITNAKVIATPTADDDRTLFEFDATLQ